ncbi:hypothetical protein Tco_0832109 [Tanacetum coccineum]
MYALSIPELDEKGGSVAIQCCQFISQRYNIKMENKIKDLHSLLFGDVTIAMLLTVGTPLLGSKPPLHRPPGLSSLALISIDMDARIMPQAGVELALES